MLASARRQYEDFVSPAGKARRAKGIEEAAASQKKPENQELERRQALAIDRRREQDLKDAAIPKPGSLEARTLERLTQLESRLASMSPEERQQPAWYKRHPEGVRRLDYGDIVEAGRPGARPLVVPNQGFFDKSLPKTAMQLVSVPWIEGYESRVKKGATEPTARVPLAVIEQMDWRAIAAMLKQLSPCWHYVGVKVPVDVKIEIRRRAAALMKTMCLPGWRPASFNYWGTAIHG